MCCDGNGLTVIAVTSNEESEAFLVLMGLLDMKMAVLCCRGFSCFKTGVTVKHNLAVNSVQTVYFHWVSSSSVACFLSTLNI